MNTPLSPFAPVQKPRKIVVPVSVGLAWGIEPNFTYQEKMDGKFAVKEVASGHFGNCILAGELMSSGEFYAFDALSCGSQDIRAFDLRYRWPLLSAIIQKSNNPLIRRVQSAANGAELLRAVLARGGEGVVRKSLSAPWGIPMEACKRLETFYCIITSIGPGQSVGVDRIELIVDGKKQTPTAAQLSDYQLTTLNYTPSGRVPLKGGKCDRVRVGSILKLEGFSLTPDGKIREPRPCKDTPGSWLVKY